MSTETSGRAKVLGAIRAGLAKGSEGERRAAVEARLAGHSRHLVPERSKQTPDRLKALFAAQLRAGNATVVEVAEEAAVPGAIATYLRSQNLPLVLRSGSDSWLAGLDWKREPSVEIVSGRAQPSDEVGLSHAVAGVAETGTLVLASGQVNPVTITFLPETSVVVLKAEDLVGPYEDAFDRLRAVRGRGSMPRTLNLVSGPSRTADVGGRLVTGAHGPRRLCVIVVG
ncbi:MAG: lactate utilization protein, partial [Proteobacteria bacterium]|nr:lactate utilization protein [Pseudomonadota bacterium]